MLIADDGETIGAISGGCLEKELRKRAAWLVPRAGAALLRFDTTSEDQVVWEFGLGCRGVVHVLLERIDPRTPPSWLRHVRDARRACSDCTIARVIESADPRLPVGDRADHLPEVAAQLADAARTRSSRIVPVAQVNSRGDDPHGGAARVRVFVEFIPAPTTLVIFGGGHDVAPVVELAHHIGWRTIVVRMRTGGALDRTIPADQFILARRGDPLAGVAIDAYTPVLVMSHNFFDDAAAIRELLRSPAPYVGVLGPASRTAEMLDSLSADGVALTPVDRVRLHAPVGLDLGAETPAEIALAMIAEIRAVLAGHAGGFLRDRSGPIHLPTLSAPPPAAPLDALTLHSCPRE